MKSTEAHNNQRCLVSQVNLQFARVRRCHRVRPGVSRELVISKLNWSLQTELRLHSTGPTSRLNAAANQRSGVRDGGSAGERRLKPVPHELRGPPLARVLPHITISLPSICCDKTVSKRHQGCFPALKTGDETCWCTTPAFYFFLQGRQDFALYFWDRARLHKCGGVY